MDNQKENKLDINYLMQFLNEEFNEIRKRFDENNKNFEILFNKLDARNKKLDEWNEEIRQDTKKIKEENNKKFEELKQLRNKSVVIDDNKEVEVRLAENSTVNVININEDVAIELYEESDRPIDTVNQVRLDLNIENKIKLAVSKDMIVNAKQSNENVCYEDTTKYKPACLKKVRWMYWRHDRGFDLFLWENKKVILSEDFTNVDLDVFKSNSGIRCDKIDNGHYGRLDIEVLGNEVI